MPEAPAILPRDRGPEQALRRLLCAERSAHGGRARPHPCADRTEWRRQDHVLQSRDRRARRPMPGESLSRAVDRRRAPLAPHAPGHRPHVPEHPSVPAFDGSGNRDDRRALPLLSFDVEALAQRGAAAPVRRSARGAPHARQRARAARVLRACRPARREGNRPALRRPAPARDGARAGDAAAAAAARRAGRRHEPARDRRTRRDRSRASATAASRSCWSSTTCAW